MFQNIGEMVVLFWHTLRALPNLARQRRKVFEQLFEIGNASLLMACILSLFIGGVIALQTGHILANKGLASSIGGLVGLAVCKELAPVMMAVLIAGRVGSAMAAEIGSMRVYQEIDALRTMNINPIRFLVMPRMLALVLAMPVLVIVADFVGWVGGGLVAAVNYQINVPFNSYFQNLQSGVRLEDVTHGLWKSMLFGLIIATVCCFNRPQPLHPCQREGRNRPLIY